MQLTAFGYYRRIVDLVLFRTYAELKAEAKRTYIGLLWWIFEPMIFMAIFYFIFGVLFARKVANFIPFLLIGLTAWHWFQSTVVQCGNALSANQPILQQVVVPKPLFATVIIFTNLIKFGVVMVILGAFLLMYGISPSVEWLYFFPIMGAFLLLTSGISMVFSAIVPLLPDLRVLIDNAFRALFFLSGIFYDISTLPPRFAELLRINPVAVLIADLRACLMNATAPDILGLVLVSMLGIALMTLGIYLMKRYRSRYVKRTM